MKLLQTMVAIATLLAIGNFATSAAERDARKGGFGDRRPGAGADGRSPFMQNASPEVREAMMKAYRESGGESRELMTKMGKLRHELAEMLSSGEVDEQAIRDKVMATAKVEAEMKIIQARMFAKMKEAGASEEMLRIMASRMGGGGFQNGAGGEGMRRGNFGGDRPGLSREGLGGRERRPERGRPDEAEGKRRRPEFE